MRVATSFPRLARELLPGPIELVDVHGSVELAPRLGLADAIVDLVSSGSTLRTNGLRSIALLLESEAVLIGPAEPTPEALQLAGVFRSVVDARGARYLMLNAPEDALDAICALVPGSRAPSVLPLAEPGHGRRAQRHPGDRRLAAAARARGGRRVVDPARAGRTDARVSRSRRSSPTSASAATRR